MPTKTSSSASKFSLTASVVTALIASCFLQPIPTASAQMGIMGGCGYLNGFADETSWDVAVEGIDLSTAIKQLRRPHSQKQSGRTIETPKIVPTSITPVPIAAIKNKLAAKATYNFEDETIEELVEWLAKQLDVNVVIDRSALLDEAIDGSETFSFRVDHISHGAALKHILSQFHLAYTLSENVLTITAQVSAENSLRTRVYPVADLGTPTDDGSQRFDLLIRCITATIAPGSWSECGGLGSIKSAKEMLVISQTDEVHEQTEQLLQALRQFSMVGDMTVADHIKVVSAEQNAANKNISAALEKTVNISFAGETLQEAIETLQVRSGVPHLFDLVALRDEAIEPSNEDVTLHLQNVSHREALQLILNTARLTYVVENEAIVVITKLAADETLTTKCYDCKSLIDVADPKATQVIDAEFANLIDVLTDSVSPESWEDVGGPATMEPIPSRGVLVVSNTRDAHAALETTLQMLLEGRRTNKNNRKVYDASEVIVKSFPLRDEYQTPAVRDEVCTAIRDMLQSSDNQLDGKTFAVSTLGSNLIISHRRDVHEVLSGMLWKLDVIDSVQEVPCGSGQPVIMSSGMQ